VIRQNSRISPQRELLYAQIDALRPLLPKGDLLCTANRLVTVRFHPFDSQKMGAVLMGDRLILVNSSRPRDAQRFSLAHELVHFFLHRGRQNGPDAAFLEWQANEGAAEILMPRHQVQQLIDAHRHTPQRLPSVMAKRFGVSTCAAAYKLKSMGVTLAQNDNIDI